MKNQSRWALLLLPFFAVSVTNADSLIQFKTMMTEEPAQSVTSGVKQRTEMEIPFMGRQISITRVDKGVIWDINPAKKIYSEKPIALPYTKSTPSSSSRKEKTSSSSKTSREKEESCTPVTTKLPKTRTIAGLKSTGYRMSCKESPKEATVIWIGEATSATDAILKEQEAYSKAYAKELYASYPANEKSQMAAGLSALGSLMMDLPQLMGQEKMPKGLWTAMETESAEGNTLFFELIQASNKSVSAAEFDIPSGFKKVKGSVHGLDMSEMGSALGEEAGEEMGSELKKMGIGGFMKSLKK